MTADSPNTYSLLARQLVEHRLAEGDLAADDIVRIGGGIMALTRDFGAYLPPSDRLRTLSEGVCLAVRAEGCHFFVLDGDQVLTLNADGSHGGIRPLEVLDTQTEECIVPLPDERGEPFAWLILTGKPGGFTQADFRAASAAAPWLRIHLRATLGMEAVRANGGSSSASLATIVHDSDLPLDEVLANLLEVAIEMVDADRGAIFFHDPATDELYTRAVTGLGAREIRVPAGMGLVGGVFLTGEVLNSPDVYGDRRFNPSVDRRTGYVTRSALCVPIVDAEGRRIGVLQAINKRDKAFDRGDERRLKVLSQQVAVVVDYSRVFQHMVEVKAFNDTILASLSNGVLTIDTDGAINYVNPAAETILKREPGTLAGRRLADVFADSVNAWLPEVIAEVATTGEERTLPQSEIETGDDQWISVNITAKPLLTEHGTALGTMVVLEDVTREQKIRRTMSRYVNDALVDTLVSGEGKLLEGTRQKISVLFSDIRSFTSLTENIGAEETVRMLNEYFSFMEDVVTNRGGMIDKYIGDALMALFGAPATTGTDADNAVTTAVDMFQVLRMFNQRRAGEPISIGIGIATGQVITGDIGSSKRLDFTAIGNPVNLSSRLESLTKLYGTDIMICGDTFAALTKPFRHRKIDFIRVRGQRNATAIYEIVDHRRPEELSANLDELFGHYGEGLDTYLAGDWETALKAFQTCLKLDDNDAASRLMLLRCRQLIANPPATWENVWTYR